MRHLKAGKRLGVTTSHRKAMMRNLVTSLLEHGEIRTTVTKAKEMRKYLDKMVGLAKRGDLHARRQAFSFIKSRDVVGKLFGEFGTLYQNRPGGYTRIFRTGFRLGDNAEMALIQMVDLNKISTKESETVSNETIEEVKKELESSEEGVSSDVVDEKDESAQVEAKSEVDQAKSEEPKTKTKSKAKKVDTDQKED